MIKTTVTLALLLVLSLQTTTDYGDTSSWGGSCTTGSSQSPIDINSRETNSCPSTMWVKVNIPCMAFSYNETGQDLAVTSGEISQISFVENGEYSVYEAEQFHFHAPSEHTINEEQYALEMHIKHTRLGTASTDSDLSGYNMSSDSYTNAVLAILFKEDTTITSDVFDNFPDNSSMIANFKDEFDCISERFFYHYKGSTTTPGCEETVNWFVLRTPLQITTTNLNRFKESINNNTANNRAAQPLNNRTVSVLSETNCDQYQTLYQEQVNLGYI